MGTKVYINKTRPLFIMIPARRMFPFPAAYELIVSTTEFIDSMNEMANKLTVILPSPIPPKIVRSSMCPAKTRLIISKN